MRSDKAGEETKKKGKKGRATRMKEGTNKHNGTLIYTFRKEKCDAHRERVSTMFLQCEGGRSAASQKSLPLSRLVFYSIACPVEDRLRQSTKCCLYRPRVPLRLRPRNRDDMWYACSTRTLQKICSSNLKKNLQKKREGMMC